MPQSRLLRLACFAAIVVFNDSASNGRQGQVSNTGQRAEQAAKAMRAGTFEDAARLYKELATQYPTDAGLRLSLATALYSARHYSEALREVEAMRASQKRNPKLWLLMGEIEIKLGDDAKALTPFREALALDPQDDGSRLELASTELELHQLSAAEEQYRLLSNKLANSPAVWQGLTLSRLGISSKALNTLKAAAPQSSYLYGLAALAASQSGDTDKAAKLYEKAAARLPKADWIEAEFDSAKYGSAISTCGDQIFACRFFKGDDKDLARDVAKVDTPEALYWTTRIYGELARQSIDRLNALPPCAEQHTVMARLYTQNGRRPEAIQELREATKLSPDDELIKSDLAEALWADRQYDEAAAILTHLTELSPEHAEWQFELGDALFNSGKPEAGMVNLRKAVVLSPGLLAAHARLGEALLRTGDTEAAVSHLELAQSLDRDGSIHFQLATAYRKLGRTVAAAKAMERQKELAAAIPKAGQ